MLVRSISRFVRYWWPLSGKGSDAGATALLTAGIFLTLMVFTALATDMGSLFLNRRQLQAATDAAALAAALDIPQAASVAGASLSSNGFGAADLVSATPGQYQENAAVPVAQRFTATAASPNAVQVQTQMQAPIYFLRAVLPESSMAISATATGLRTDVAAFTAGTGLVAVNGGIANAVLGQMLGSSISLSAVSYQGLINTNIGVADFLNSLATEINLSAGTYNQVLASQVTVGQILNAEINAATIEGLSSGAAFGGLQALVAQATGSQTFTLSNLLNIDYGQDQQVGTLSSSSPGAPTVNLYGLVGGSLQLANGSNAVALTGVVNLPGIATADLYMTMIEPAQPAEPYIEYGPVGMSVHTAQVRMLLTIHLLSALSILGQSGAVTIPVYLELASGNATLSAINCGTQPATDATVTIAAQPSVAAVYIAQVNKSLMTNFTQPVSTNTPATLVTLGGLLSVTGKATLNLGSPTATDLTFDQTEMRAQPPQSQTVASTGMAANAIDTLANSLQLQVTALGLPLLPGVAQLVTAAVAGALSPVLSSLDSLVDPILATAGIQPGYITVTANGARCGVPTLVF